MLGRRDAKTRQYACVLIDVDTQRDLLDPHGTRPVRHGQHLIPPLRRVVAWAKWNQVPVVSAVSCHRPDEVLTEGVVPYCLDGTTGQSKLNFTVFGSYVKVEGDNTLAVPIDLFERFQQVIFRKPVIDFFLNPKADRFLTHLRVAEYLLVGCGMEESIQSIALGLLARGKQVTLVGGACGWWDELQADMAKRRMVAKGVQLTTVDELLQRRMPRPIRYPRNGIGQVPLRNGLYGSAPLFVPAPAERNGHNGHAGGNGHHHANGQNGANGHAVRVTGANGSHICRPPTRRKSPEGPTPPPA